MTNHHTPTIALRGRMDGHLPHLHVGDATLKPTEELLERYISRAALIIQARDVLGADLKPADQERESRGLLREVGLNPEALGIPPRVWLSQLGGQNPTEMDLSCASLKGEDVHIETERPSYGALVLVNVSSPEGSLCMQSIGWEEVFYAEPTPRVVKEPIMDFPPVGSEVLAKGKGAQGQPVVLLLMYPGCSFRILREVYSDIPNELKVSWDGKTLKAKPYWAKR